MTETKQKENQTSDCIRNNHFGITELRKCTFFHLYFRILFIRIPHSPKSSCILLCIAPRFHSTIYCIVTKAFFGGGAGGGFSVVVLLCSFFLTATLVFCSYQYRISACVSWSWRQTTLGSVKELGIDQSGINRLVNFKWLSFKQHLDYPMQKHLNL